VTVSSGFWKHPIEFVCRWLGRTFLPCGIVAACGGRSLTPCAHAIDSITVPALPPRIGSSFSVDNGSFDKDGNIFLFDGVDACVGLHTYKTKAIYPFDMHFVEIVVPRAIGTYSVPSSSGVAGYYAVKGEPPDPMKRGLIFASQGTVTVTAVVEGVRIAGELDVVLEDPYAHQTGHVHGKFDVAFCVEDVPYGMPNACAPM
jgi:hypothetical protein